MKRIIVSIYLLMISMLYANFQVGPQVQKVSLNRPGTQKIYLRNDTNKLKKIKIYSQRPEDQKTKDLYMGDWIIVYPKLVYLKPNSKKTIRMAARPPQGLVDGEYRSHLVFEELPVKKYDNSEKDESKAGVNIDIIHILVSTVYGYRGKLEYGGIFEDFQVVTDKEKAYFVSKITNTGTTALDVVYKVTYYENMKKLKTEDLLVGKAMRENYLDSITELNKISKGANKMKVEYYYRIPKGSKEVKEGEEEYDEFKLGEKLISIKKISAEKYLKELEEKKKAEVEAKKLEKEKVEIEGKKES
ncbi:MULTISPECIES: molecular chaperone [Psychrilyobacter]|nr:MULTISPECIES: molecular chaperone [Psychrilyobacter]NDI76366.1 molecular chaperone [Psychrilyobacter piezotolerans]